MLVVTKIRLRLVWRDLCEVEMWRRWVALRSLQGRTKDEQCKLKYKHVG